MLKTIILLISLGYYNETCYYQLYRELPLTEQNVEQAINDLNIQCPESSLIHLKNESGGFKSRIANKFNNITGMKLAQHRSTLAIGRKKNNVAVYDCWLSSLIDYKLWQGRRRIKGNYFKYLKKRRYIK